MLNITAANTSHLPTAAKPAGPKPHQRRREAIDDAVLTLGPHARREYEFEVYQCDGKWFWRPTDTDKPMTAAELKAQGGLKAILALEALKEGTNPTTMSSTQHMDATKPPPPTDAKILPKQNQEPFAMASVVRSGHHRPPKKERTTMSTRTKNANANASPIDDRLAQIGEVMAKLQREAEEIAAAKQVYERYGRHINRPANGNATKQHKKVLEGAPRPPGTPTNFEMVVAILQDAEKHGKGAGLTANELVRTMETRYWPGLTGEQVLSSIYLFAKRGRLLKTGDRFKLPAREWTWTGATNYMPAQPAEMGH